MANKLTSSEVQHALSTLNNTLEEGQTWQLENNTIVKTFTFKSFIRAFGWMSQIAIWAERLNHHPEWFNVYSTLEVTLATHDAGGVTELDIELAGFMDQTAQA